MLVSDQMLSFKIDWVGTINTDRICKKYGFCRWKGYRKSYNNWLGRDLNSMSEFVNNFQLNNNWNRKFLLTIFFTVVIFQSTGFPISNELNI